MVPNDSPFHLETHATGFIQQQDERSKGLDDEIAQKRVRPHALEAPGTELAKFRDLHGALPAPIQKLPPEILGEVFIQSLLGSWDEGTWSANRRGARPSLLQVCQRWKCTAIGAPGLWTMLRFADGPYNCVQMCPDNSGCLPIQTSPHG